MTITERIREIIEKKGLTASSFADKLGVQRSGMSHIFSGRNKPSLDLIMKIAEVFPDVDIGWLVLGTGSGVREIEPEHGQLKSAVHHEAQQKEVTNVIPSEKTDVNKNKVTNVTQKTVSSVEVTKTLKVILLKADGTFSEYLPSGHQA
ncbi:MAG: helix-turn-helix transcriptional regulator [Bacteroidales bacterium]